MKCTPMALRLKHLGFACCFGSISLWLIDPSGRVKPPVVARNPRRSFQREMLPLLDLLLGLLLGLLLNLLLCLFLGD